MNFLYRSSRVFFKPLGEEECIEGQHIKNNIHYITLQIIKLFYFGLPSIQFYYAILRYNLLGKSLRMSGRRITRDERWIEVFVVAIIKSNILLIQGNSS